VPSRETKALDQVIADLHLKEQSPQQAIRTLTAFFLDKFTYSTWQETPRWRRSQETPLSRFLLSTRSGHCEYFATSGVLLLRRLGIPTRYAVGYAVHEGSGRKYVVRQRDAHAWCLVWDERTGLWQDVDFTPASWVEAEAQRASLFQFLRDIWSRIWFEFSKFRWGQSHLRQYLLWSLVPILAFLLYQIVFRRRRRRQQADKSAAGATVIWPGLDSEFYQLEKRLVEQGVVRQPNEPLSDWLQRALREPALAELQSPLQALLQLHYRYRFDPQGLSASEREQLQQEATACVEKIRRGPERHG
ncbi:MAG TPA: transglutaminase domain-containing protein, partial [Candidatus Sulfotelmatobacter sp.]|nr:transglutaminase domain-containing protein [Candidatus Sulfotelmatobacter sp.]